MKTRVIVLTIVSSLLAIFIVPFYVGYLLNWEARTGVVNLMPTAQTLWFLAPIAVLGGLWLILVAAPRVREKRQTDQPPAPSPVAPKTKPRTPRVLGTTADGRVVEELGFGRYRTTPAKDFRPRR